jgi:hypothetical protein
LPSSVTEPFLTVALICRFSAASFSKNCERSRKA